MSDDFSVFPGDHQLIVRHFETQSAQYREEDYAYASHYRDAYSTRNFAERTREQLSYYPGLQNSQSTLAPTDPSAIVAAQEGQQKINYWQNSMSSPEGFMAGLKGRERDIDWGELVTNPSIGNVSSAIVECIPCLGRLFDGAQLLPNGNLLEIHLLNIKLRFDLLDKLMDLLKNPGYNINICKLLEMLSHLCPQDLLALLATLSQYLAKLNLDFSLNLDLIIELIGPILSPFLEALGEWLDKWIQMIIAPIICVVDHINQTLYIAQQFKLPFSESQMNLNYHVGVAGPNALGDSGLFSHARSEGSVAAGTGYEGNPYNPFEASFAGAELFNTPDYERYNPEPPHVPDEEIAYALDQIENGYGDTYMERQERQAVWDEIKARRWQAENQIPPRPRPIAGDGTRWSPNNIPTSEKTGAASFSSVNYPPEDQKIPKPADQYYMDAGAIIDPIIQVRNIIQAAIAYVQDWFDWATQLIYDLLGTDFGWMSNKMGQTMLKTNIIQLIFMIEALLSAIVKNGLKCGTDTNFDEEQLRYILEKQLSGKTGYTFTALPDGSFKLVAATATPNESQDGSGDTISTSEATAQPISTGTGSGAQKTSESGIIIKDCLKEVSAQDLSKVREWIADFEKRSTNGG